MNFFNRKSSVYPVRWSIIATLVVSSLLAYANMTGWSILGSGTQQQWSATGPGYHK